ncbi:hypothetical protein PHET_12260 [Paragonimus heterotremus]|uniref:Uncharacterized protein n=1 Tax=Paragonimus heterotremus TaxID=100268 RepID=A0A8J4WC93_9TREM|nr:hypothetical protein PHET_12260 [Paragonimus heterotremus]
MLHPAKQKIFSADSKLEIVSRFRVDGSALCSF